MPKKVAAKAPKAVPKEPYKDHVGRILEIGQIIAYATMWGQSAALQLAIVQDIWCKPTARWEVVSGTHQKVPFDEPRITVLQIDRGTVSEKKNTLFSTNKIIILNKEELPESITDLIDGANL
jgi:hypothetical protein